MISQSHRSLGPGDAVQLAALAFFNMCFVDDAAVFELDTYGRAQASSRAYDWCLFQAFGRSLNLKKLSVDGMLGFSHTFWGITYHLDRAVEGVVFVWVELTRSKKAKAAAMVRLPFALTARCASGAHGRSPTPHRQCAVVVSLRAISPRPPRVALCDVGLVRLGLVGPCWIGGGGRDDVGRVRRRQNLAPDAHRARRPRRESSTRWTSTTSRTCPSGSA